MRLHLRCRLPPDRSQWARAHRADAFDFDPPDGDYRDYPFVGHRAHPNDPQALRNYTERYDYDAVGNFEACATSAANGEWTRRYDYDGEQSDRGGQEEQPADEHDGGQRRSIRSRPTATTRTAT